jgi:DNA-binding transcriptional LysR family regulator
MDNKIPMIRLDALEMFSRVAELSSFTRAAESLGVPKATLSAAVRQLEADVGVTLLYRTTRRVQLTHDGQVFHERCRDLLSDAEEVGAMFLTSATAAGRIRVDMPVHMARNLVVPRLGEFLAEHPALHVELSCTDRRVDVVREGFDCVVRVGGRADSGLIARSLGAFDVVTCASPAYLKAYGTPRRLEDLKRHRMVHYVGQMGGRPEGFEYPDGDGWRSLPMDGSITVNNTESYSAAALAGLGIIQVPRLGVERDIAEGRLVEIMKRFRAEPMPVALVYPQRRNLALRVRLFMDWIAGVLKPHTV